MDATSSRPVLSERNLLLLLAAVQFTHIMDFMIMMPLGPQLMRELHLGSAQFAAIISTFALTAGLVGLAVAPFIDRFDRRQLLLFCYAGFTLGTLACGFSTTHEMLLIARAVCGAFGGVSGATVMAIVSDVVPPERRARGMGLIMTAFSAASALGVPFGLKLAQWWKWEAPFLITAGAAALVWLALFYVLPPVRAHLGANKPPMGRDFVRLLGSGNAWIGIVLMISMIFGHFTIIPYLSPYLVSNVGMPEKSLFLVYLCGGLVTVFTGPMVGRLADRYGRFRVYIVLVFMAGAIIRVITSSGPMPVWEILIFSTCFFVFASSRFIPGQAVISLAVPPPQRGAYMSLISCSRDLASGTAAAIAGQIVYHDASGKLQNFHWLGIFAISVSFISLFIFRLVRQADAVSL
ncbi:MAG: MFS transporter [Luteolibacter sp.]